MKFVGVDLETSGIDHKTSVPIQFGIAFQGINTWYAWDIGWDWNQWEWNEEAAAIHNISKYRLEKAMDAKRVDSLIESFLDRNKIDGQRFCMIGWNVAGFDRPFIEKHLPKTFSMFSYRTIDLNAICFALAIPNVRSYDRVKRNSKEYALERMGNIEGGTWHDAGFDALASLYSYEYLRSLTNAGVE
jgi:DNA polymerase III epsilon subunit-like protein